MRNSFKDLTYSELVEKRDSLQKEYMDLRMDKVLGHIENPLRLRTVRKDLARVNTIIHEYALGIREKTK